MEKNIGVDVRLRLDDEHGDLGGCFALRIVLVACGANLGCTAPGVLQIRGPKQVHIFIGRRVHFSCVEEVCLSQFSGGPDLYLEVVHLPSNCLPRP